MAHACGHQVGRPLGVERTPVGGCDWVDPTGLGLAIRTPDALGDDCRSPDEAALLYLRVMQWQAGKAYSIEAEAPDGELVYLGEQLTYVGEITLEWTAHTIHVFKTPNESLLGLRDEDIGSATPTI